MAWGLQTWTTGAVVTKANMDQGVNANFTAAFPDEVSGVSWTPTLEADTTNASASVTGRRYRIGALQFVWARWVLTSVGSGVYFVTLPVAASGITASAAAASGQVIGSFAARDLDPNQIIEGSVVLRTSTTAWFNANSVVNPAEGGVMRHNTPRVWAADDVISFHAVYPVA
jgi:hypothetical protein